MRVLYSFPSRLGAGRICDTAWNQIDGLAQAGAGVTAFVGSVLRPAAPSVALTSTLAMGSFRLPARILGRHLASRLHDLRVAGWLRKNHEEVDVVHCWPLGAIHTLRCAREYGIPSFLERPNTHTGYAFQVSAEEERIVGLSLPKGHDHESNALTLSREEEEYRETDFLLCPSDFVKQTFLERGLGEQKLLRHQYGYHPGDWTPDAVGKAPDHGLVVLYAGVGEPRKGLHYALRAWRDSSASEKGEFWICGAFVDGYAALLGNLLDHPRIKVLGHRKDLPELMRQADVFVLSSVEEGSALVTYEARASGCVLAVSNAVGAMVTHQVTGLVHAMRDVGALTRDLTLLNDDRAFLGNLRKNSLLEVPVLSWAAAGKRLLEVYKDGSRAIAKAAKTAPSIQALGTFQ